MWRCGTNEPTRRGASKDALVPSGAQTGVKLVGLPADASTIVLDFDAAKSIVQTGTGELLMKPVISASADGAPVGATAE